LPDPGRPPAGKPHQVGKNMGGRHCAVTTKKLPLRKRKEGILQGRDKNLVSYKYKFHAYILKSYQVCGIPFVFKKNSKSIFRHNTVNVTVRIFIGEKKIWLQSVKVTNICIFVAV
jgi:hypothetical protein